MYNIEPCCRHELDITALTGCLEREEKARTEEAAEHATSAAALQKNIADLQVAAPACLRDQCLL